MNNLEIAQKIQLAPTLTLAESKFIEVRQGEIIKNVPVKDIKAHLNTLIYKTHLDCNRELDTANVAQTIDDLAKDVKNYAGTLTLAQLDHAFKLGLDNTFGEWYGLSNKTYRQWVRGYLGYSVRIDANKKQSQFLKHSLHKPKELTDSEKEKIIIDGVFRAFEDFKKKGDCSDLGNVTYSYLDKKGLISFTKDRKWDFYREAKKKKRRELEMKMEISVNRHELESVSSILEQLDLNKVNDDVLTEAKQVALCQYFSDLIETGTELKDLL